MEVDDTIPQFYTSRLFPFSAEETALDSVDPGELEAVGRRGPRTSLATRGGRSQRSAGDTRGSSGGGGGRCHGGCERGGRQRCHFAALDVGSLGGGDGGCGCCFGGRDGGCDEQEDVVGDRRRQHRAGRGPL